MTTILPEVSKLVFEKAGNEIWQYFDSKSTLTGVQIITTNPFVIESEGKQYLLTNDKELTSEDFDFIILTTKKPTRPQFNEGKVILRRWIKHPLFQDKTPEDVVDSWKDKFKFIKEDETQNIKGLRPPQIGALYSILAHLQNPEDKAIIVMPTGTGKTETMLATLISNCCSRILISVPSDSLRTQISNKFISLGLLKEFGIVDPSCLNPLVGIINHGFANELDLQEFTSKCNVVISTIHLLTGLSQASKALLNNIFSHFFVDEAHHSEADTWKELISKFNKEKVFLFTATPFRNDGKNLQGKIIFNFSLRKAQEQKYYKTINYLPIREYKKDVADEKIAEQAVKQLKLDIEAGHNHIIMARCMSKPRAREVIKYYEKYPEHNPVVIYNGVPSLADKMEAIKRGEHSIIVCVNMLGEGFDLPALKIAAIHDERQSLPITLQFIGRFTRTSYDQLGNASFVTNIAYPPLHEELDQLYARNADWNILLPRLSENATQKEINIREFLDGFDNLDESIIPFAQINPALSTIIFRNTTNEWKPGQQHWEEIFSNYEHVFSDSNHTDTLVIVLGKIEKIEWGNFEAVQNLRWDIIILHWDLRPNINRIFLNTSLKGFSAKDLIDKIFAEGSSTQITGMGVFRIFNNVNRLSLFNVGARKGMGQDITFQSYFGKAVQDGIKLLEQGTVVKNNIFGVGFKEGEKASLGCSVKGKIWSYQRGNLDELIKWCKEIGQIVEDETIDPNVVLQHTLSIEKISIRPAIMPILIDWNPDMYENIESRYQIAINGTITDFANLELNLTNPTTDQDLIFSVDTTDDSVQFKLEIGVNAGGESFYKITQIGNAQCLLTYSTTSIDLAQFFQSTPPTIWFADNSQLFGNLYVKQKNQPSVFSTDSILSDNWQGVDIGKESQDIAPYITDSIQYYFIDKIKADFQLIYDDDGKGEIADIIGINDLDTSIDVHLYHLKYAKNGVVGNDIENFYQVCGQAQKSLKWKHKDGREFFNHLFRRKEKSLNGNTCNRLIKGTEQELEQLAEQVKWTKAIKFHIYIVQPSLSKANPSQDILLLLGNVEHYLATVGNITLKVYSSN